MALDIFRKFFLKILLLSGAATVVLDAHAHNNQDVDFDPEFLAPLENMTITQGRDVSFTCVVNELGTYKVAWIKSDSKAILAIHTHMVALNQRLSVTHNGHNTWKLHIAHVQLNDSGTYMCQVNTDPMRSQSGHLDVVVSPDILNGPGQHGNAAMEEGLINEGGQTQLLCSATGVPEPTVQWRREDGKDIVLRSADGRDKQSVKFVEGERLTLQQVQRSDMGGYLCIASNGIPPSVSKRFDVQVMFPPVVKAVINLISTPSGSQVLLQCIVEVSPKPLNGWYRHEGNVKLHDGSKYIISEGLLNAYTWQMNLTIRNLQKHDFGSYVCNSVNAMGKQDDRIRINEIAPPVVETTTAPPYVYTTVKSHRDRTRKPSHQGNKSKVGGGGGANGGNGHDGQKTGRGRGGGGADGSGVASIGGGAPNHIQENEIVGGIGSAEGKQSAAGSGTGTLGTSGNGMNSSGSSINGMGGNGGGGSGGGGSGGAGTNSISSGGGIEKTRNALSTVPSKTTGWILHSSSIKNSVRGNLIIWICGAVLLLPRFL